MNNFYIAGIDRPVLSTEPIYPGSRFTWGEATKNGSRLPILTMFEGRVVQAAQITKNIITLAKELDKIRAQFGSKPMTITSWLRPPLVNASVRGVSNSQHLLGWAADFQIAGIAPHVVAAKLRPAWKGGLGDSDTFTHVDMRQLMGKPAAWWDYGNA